MACICCIEGGEEGKNKEEGRIGRYRVFRGIEGGKVISIEAVLSL